MRACTIEGCSQRLSCRGLCVMHYQRLRKEGTPGEVGRRIGERGEGHVADHGYRRLYLPDHPLARAQGKVYEHRVVLFDHIGADDHVCHWCGKAVAWEAHDDVELLIVDHLDEDRLNNAVENLVPSCLDCNTSRAAA